MTVRNANRHSVPLSALPDFTPVPRKVQRHDGWTPERQRAFIEALADTGCVAIAARMVNMSGDGAYQLRRQPGAQSFRAAWDAAQTLGLQVVKDEAFHRAMHGEMIPVFVGGKLMGFRRKKNDRLLMFILRNYGFGPGGTRTTVNYVSTRATAGAASSPSPHRGCDPSGGRVHGPGEGESGALAAAEASTTTVKTIVTGPGASSDPLAADTDAANMLNAFEGVELDAEAQDQIHRALTQCAERRRALEQDPENDPERFFIGVEETNSYLGELESGVEDDWIPWRSGTCPEQGRRGEHLWENLGEGGEAERIDRVVAEIEERRAKRTPEEIAAEEAEDEAEVQRRRAARANSALPKPEPDPDDPRSDWSNWTTGSYVPPSDIGQEEMEEDASPSPVRGCDPSGGRVHGWGEGMAEVPISPRLRKSEEPAPAKAGGRPLKRYKKRQPKPPFTPPAACPGPRSGEARKAEAVAAVKAKRRELADAEAERRRRRKESGDSYS
jgi:hypothetical protein